MDRLNADERLDFDDQIVSPKGWFTLRMFMDGALGLYRTQVNWSVWASPALNRPGGFAILQQDGNLVTYSPEGAPYWSTGTSGHPGAWLAVQDDGNLVVYDAANHPLWASNTVIDTDGLTISYQDRGYLCNETSETLKVFCQQFPCFSALQWPGYATDVIETTIDAQDIVIQLWKGYCLKSFGFAGVTAFPGGVGAEVGIYRRIPGKLLPSVPSFFQGDFANKLRDAATNDLWWPFPEFEARLEFTLINPRTGETFLHAGPQTGYWLTKWMDDNAYNEYKRDQTTPAGFTDYILDYTINGRHYRRWPSPPLRQRAWSPAT